MKTIFIIRHAITESPSFNQEDWARQLLPSGIREAENISNAMKAKGKTLDFILSSDAKRTRKTAEIFQKTLELPSEKISFHHELYNARLSALWDAIKHLPNAYDVVGIIAHNPGVTHLANDMSDDFNIDHLTTCGIVGFEADVEDWKNFEKASKRNCYYDDPSRYF